MSKPCTACHNTGRLPELRHDANGRPEPSGITRPCILCLPVRSWPPLYETRHPNPMVSTFEMFINGQRVTGHEGEERDTTPRALRGMVLAETMDGCTVYTGARKWRDPIAGPRVDLHFTRHHPDGAADQIVDRIALHRERGLRYVRSAAQLHIGQRVYLTGQGRYGTVTRRRRRGVVVRPDGCTRPQRIALNALLAA